MFWAYKTTNFLSSQKQYVIAHAIGVGCTYLGAGAWSYLYAEEYLSTLRIMKKEKEFIDLIEDLEYLLSEQRRTEKVKFEKLEKEFDSFYIELVYIYTIEKRKRLNNIISFRESYSFLKETSVIECIKKEQRETYHSHILAKLWNNPIFGANLLKELLSLISDIQNREQVQEWILEKDYDVKEEDVTNENKKPDIIIIDRKKRWGIVLENKINSSVHGDEKTQLEYYSLHINRILPNDAIKIQILLSHTLKNKQYAKEFNWIYIDYYLILQTLIKNYNGTESLLQQYIMHLFYLLFRDKNIGEAISDESSIYEMNDFYNNVILKLIK